MSVPVISPKRSYDPQNEATFREEVRKLGKRVYTNDSNLLVPFGKKLQFTSAQGQVITFGYNASGNFTIQQDAGTPFGLASLSFVSTVESTLTASIATLETTLTADINDLSASVTTIATAQADLETAFAALEVDVAAANAAASAAATSALAAAASQTAAGSSASAAATSATNAATSASNASTSASQASTSETNAAGSAATATTQATNAANSATAAGNSASAASTSASSASTSASNAATSASAANTSATNAATQASNAATSASQASTSETNAAGSAASASTSATNAASSQSAAAGSASAASTSASTASTQASNAATSASAAATSATSAATQATNAATSASTATTQASNASASAAAASSSATLSATYAQGSQGSINSSATFADNANATGVPTNWNNWENGSGTRVSGISPQPYAFQLVGGAGASAGIYGPLTGRIATGWYVIEADVTLNSGALTGAGVYIDWNDGGVSLTFSTDVDINGAVIGAGTTGQLYRFRKLVQVTKSTTFNGMYAMSHWAGHGSIAAANDITWHRCALRAASQPEIEARQAKLDLVTANANIATNASAIATETSARAAADTTLTASLGTTNANVSTNASAIATINSAAAFWETVVSAGGGDLAAVRLKAGASGSYLELISTVLRLANVSNGAVIEVMRAISGEAYFSRPISADGGGERVTIGPGYGVSGSEVVLWFGADTIAPSSQSRTNGYFALGTDGKIYYGTTELTNPTVSVFTKSANVGGFGTSGTTVHTIATIDVNDVPAGGFIKLLNAYLPVGSYTLSAGTTWDGQLIVTEQLQSGGTEYTLHTISVQLDTGLLGFTYEGGNDPGFIFPKAPNAQNVSGNCRYRLKLQRTSGTNNISTSPSSGGFFQIERTPG